MSYRLFLPISLSVATISHFLYRSRSQWLPYSFKHKISSDLENEQTFDLPYLPNEMWRLIFSECSSDSWHSILLTCKRFYELGKPLFISKINFALTENLTWKMRLKFVKELQNHLSNPPSSLVEQMGSLIVKDPNPHVKISAIEVLTKFIQTNKNLSEPTQKFIYSSFLNSVFLDSDESVRKSALNTLRVLKDVPELVAIKSECIKQVIRAVPFQKKIQFLLELNQLK
jgi:hypothetical protein